MYFFGLKFQAARSVLGVVMIHFVDIATLVGNFGFSAAAGLKSSPSNRKRNSKKREYRISNIE